MNVKYGDQETSNKFVSRNCMRRCLKLGITINNVVLYGEKTRDICNAPFFVLGRIQVLV